MSHVQRSLLEIGKRLLFPEEEGRWATSGQNKKISFFTGRTRVLARITCL